MKQVLLLIAMLSSAFSYSQNYIDIDKPSGTVNLPPRTLMGKTPTDLNVTFKFGCVQNGSLTFNVIINSIGGNPVPKNNSIITLPITPNFNPYAEDFGFIMVPIRDTITNRPPKINIYGFAPGHGITPKPDQGGITGPEPKPSPTPKPKKDEVSFEVSGGATSLTLPDFGIIGLINIDTTIKRPTTINIYGYAPGHGIRPKPDQGGITGPEPKPSPSPTPKKKTIEINQNSPALTLPFCDKKYRLNINIDPRSPVITINNFATL